MHVTPRLGWAGTFLLLATAPLALAPSASWATTWGSATGGTFQNPAAWNPVGVPGVADVAYFPHAGAYTVDFNQNATTDRIDITAGDVTFDLNSRTYLALKSTLFSSLPGSLHVSGPTEPSLTVTDGTLEIQSATLGHASGATGKLIVDGAGAMLIAHEALLVGQGGEGWVTLQQGAQGEVPLAFVGVTGSAGIGSVLQVVDEGSYLTIDGKLHVGSSGGKGLAGAGGGGTLDVAELLLAPSINSVAILSAVSDSHVIVRGDALLGLAAGVQGGHATLNAVGGGTITIHGALEYDHKSQFILNGLLDVGSMTRVNAFTHQGLFILWQGGGLRVRSDVSTFDLGFSALDQDVHVQIDGDLHFDDRRDFLLNVSTATVSASSLSGNGHFGFASGTLNLDTLTLGTAGDMRQSLEIDSLSPPLGKLNVAGATDVQSGGQLSLSKAQATFGGLVVSEGSLAISQSQVAFNGNGQFFFKGLLSAGQLAIADSTIAGTVAAAPGSQFSVDGNVTFNGPVRSAVDLAKLPGAEQPQVAINDEFHVGAVAALAAQIEVAADVTFGPASKLVIELGGLGPGEFDTLQVGGIVTLGGTLEVSLMSSYVPALGDHFLFLSAGRLVGTFDDLALPTLEGGLEFDLGLAQLGELLVVSGLPGDYNNDGAVDAGDYTVWRNHMGTNHRLPNDPTPGVDIGDYERWQRRYGDVLPGAAALVARVPEPSGVWGMLIFGLLAGLVKYHSAHAGRRVGVAE